MCLAYDNFGYILHDGIIAAFFSIINIFIGKYTHSKFLIPKSFLHRLVL